MKKLKWKKSILSLLQKNEKKYIMNMDEIKNKLVSRREPVSY